jgi:glucose-1-phosphate thymidylyltransferase
MQILILAAGYATRLYPLTLDRPKPLLPVAGKPMLEHVIDNLIPIPDIEEILIVTNQKFARHFEEWAEQYRATKKAFDFKIINDGSTSDADKLGAIGDMHFVTRREKIGNLLVVAGDNLFSTPLGDFGDFCRAKDEAVLALYDVGDLEAIKKYNNVTIDDDGRIAFFEEKPKNPQSTLTGIALYYYPERIVKMLDTYIAEGNNPDQPGRFIQWLYPRVPVSTWRVPGIWYDIGSKETLEEADRIFADLAAKV